MLLLECYDHFITSEYKEEFKADFNCYANFYTNGNAAFKKIMDVLEFVGFDDNGHEKEKSVQLEFYNVEALQHWVKYDNEKNL